MGMYEYIPYYKNRTTENLFAEMWFPIIGYEGYYECANYARIKSLYNRFWQRRDFILSQFKDKDGYLMVSLAIRGKSKQKRVHVIVGDIFCDNPLKKPIYNHEDGVKDNNLPYNLKPSTYSENTVHAYRIGLIKDCNAKITRDQVLEISNSTETPSELAKKYNITVAAISSIKIGKNWSAVSGIKRIREQFRRPTKEMVVKILNSTEKGVLLAERYNLSTCTISCIRTGRHHSKIINEQDCNSRGT